MGHQQSCLRFPRPVIFTLVLVVLVMLSAPVFGDDQSLSITNTAGLEFGGVVAYTGGTVVVPPTGSRSSTGAVVLLTLPGYGAGPASFTVTGDADEVYHITLPTGSVTLTASGGTMTVDTFTSSPNHSGTISGSPPHVLKVGATLHVSSSQATGRYTGSFSVTIYYE